MNCFVCKGDMEEGLTSHVVTLDSGCTIIIKNVPCMKCTQCGEVWYNGKVMAQLESIVKTLESSITEIAVVNFSNKVA